MSIQPPRVFVSYSHDSAEHKQWVLEFATTLRNRGVDAILDQWDLKPGDDLPEFMEQNLAACDYAVMVCTQRYVTKANTGEGGVGYEKMIMTSSSLTKISDSKVIPILREKGTPSVPTFLQTKLYIDFSDNSEVEYALDELLRALLNAPLFEKPLLGADPFKPLEDARPNRSADGIREVMTAFVASYDDTCLDYVKSYNILKKSKLRRLTFEKYLEETLAASLLVRYGEYEISLTDKGVAYLNREHIVDA
ncbi:MAG: toll/interleukin-1 receptor domain-containing protein [Akkermansiaceae bacterium]